MKKDYVILGLGILSAVLLFDKFYSKSKTTVDEVDEAKSDADISACEEAVNKVMAEKTKFIRMSKEGMEKMRQQEMEKCLNS